MSSCTTIDSAGTYELTQDLSFSSGTCLNFLLDSTEKVVIKGNGYAISYTGSPTQYPPACVKAFTDGTLEFQNITFNNCEVHAEPHLSTNDPKGYLAVWYANFKDSVITVKHMYNFGLYKSVLNITPSITTYYGSSDLYKFIIKVDILNKTPSAATTAPGNINIITNSILTSIESSPSFYTIAITNCNSDECYAPPSSQAGYTINIGRNKIKVSPRAGQIIMALNGIPLTMSGNNIYGSSNGSVVKILTSSGTYFSYENLNVHGSSSAPSEGISVSTGAFGVSGQPSTVAVENSLIKSDKNPLVISTSYNNPVVNNIKVNNNIFEGNLPSGGSTSNGMVIAVNSIDPCSRIEVKNNRLSGYYEPLKIEFNAMLGSACSQNLLEVSGNYFASCIPGAPSLHATGTISSNSRHQMYIYNNAFMCDPRDDSHTLSSAGVEKSMIRWNVEPYTSKNIVGGPKIGGNYYSNYSSPDSDGDGFGDEPKLVSDPAEPPSFHNKDLYPLVGNAGNIPALTISLLSPQNGSTMQAGDISLTANVTSNINESVRCNIYVVSLFSGKDVITKTWVAQLNANIPSTYQETIQLEPGNYKWYVFCEGFLAPEEPPSHTAYSTENFFTVASPGTSLVTLTLLSPADNAVLTSQQVQFLWTATSTAGNNKVSCNLSVVKSGVVVVSASSLTSSTGNYSYQANLEVGQYTWTVACTDGQSTATGFRNFSVTAPDSQPPTITLLSPSNGATVQPSVTFTYIASDNVELKECSLYINNQVVNKTKPANNTQVSYTTTLLQGSYTWNVQCSDLAGNIGNSPVWSFTVQAPAETNPPIVTLIAPPEGAILDSRTVAFKFSVADQSMPTNCILYVDAVPSSQITATSNSTIELTLQLSSGLHSWHVVCTDAYGNSGTSSTGHFEVLSSNDTIAPEVVLNFPAEGASVRNPVNFRWTATDSSEPIMCTLYIDSSAKTTLPSPSGSVVSSSQVVSTGSHTWKVSCRDGNGNEGSSQEQSFVVYSGSSGGGGGNDKDRNQTNQTVGPASLYIEVTKECPDKLKVKVTSGGVPVSGALVSAGQYTSTTGADGKATLTLPQGTYSLTASKSGYESYTLSNIVLDCPAVSFESEIKCSIDNVPVLFLYSSLSLSYTIFENGVYVSTFEGKQLTYSLAPGKSYKVVGEKQGYQPYQKEFVAPSCQLGLIDASLTYECVEEKAQAKLKTFVSGVRMVLYRGSQIVEDKIIDGVYTATLEPDSYTFKLSKEGYLDKLIQASFTCRKETPPIIITLSNNSTVVGQEVVVYTTSGGKPVDVMLTFTYPDGSIVDVTTLKGEYAFVPTMAGTYTLKAGTASAEIFVAESTELPLMWVIIPILIILLLAVVYYLYSKYASKGGDEKGGQK